MVVDIFCAAFPWGMCLTRQYNEPLSQRFMWIPIALCLVVIVVVVWPAVGLCLPEKTSILSVVMVVIVPNNIPPSVV